MQAKNSRFFNFFLSPQKGIIPPNHRVPPTGHGNRKKASRAVRGPNAMTMEEIFEAVGLRPEQIREIAQTPDRAPKIVEIKLERPRVPCPVCGRPVGLRTCTNDWRLRAAPVAPPEPDQSPTAEVPQSPTADPPQSPTVSADQPPT